MAFWALAPSCIAFIASTFTDPDSMAIACCSNVMITFSNLVLLAMNTHELHYSSATSSNNLHFFLEHLLPLQVGQSTFFVLGLRFRFRFRRFLFNLFVQELFPVPVPKREYTIITATPMSLYHHSCPESAYRFSNCAICCFIFCSAERVWLGALL